MIIFQSPLLLHLTSSFLISNLRLQIEPENGAEEDSKSVQTPFILISPNRNISFGLHGYTILVDGLPLLPATKENIGMMESGRITVMARCEHGFAFRVSVGNQERTIASPSFCANHGMNQILIGPDDREEEKFYGCIRNITFGPNKILSSWCRLRSSSTAMAKELRSSTSGELLSSAPPDLQPVYIGERLKCPENGSIRLMWKNLYLFPEHRRYKIHYADVKFRLIDGPLHGQILLNDSVVQEFTYDDIINQRLIYLHDGSETLEDSLDFKVWVEGQNDVFSLSEHNPRVLTLPFQIDPVDDLPQLMLGSNGGILNVTPASKILLTNKHLKIWDVDTPPTEVWIEVKKNKGAHLCTADGDRLSRFSLSQFLNKKVYLKSEGGRGEVELSARSNPDLSVTLRLISAPVRLQIQTNTGLKLPHRSNRLISNANLSFVSNFPEIPVFYSVLDSAKSGLIECLKEIPTGGLEEFQVCSVFTQEDLMKFKVRYRHTSSNRPPSDTFSFNVKCGDQQSPTNYFTIDFIPVSVRVYVERSLLLNNTEQSLIGRRNLLATAYPEPVATDQLTYHVVEPPKFGMLTRQVNGKMRRIGLSSNFTQQHIDDGTLLYKLHYAHFSVLNDYFMFRVIIPAVATELLRFDITFIPGGNAIQLVNRTLVVSEGHSQQISNKTIWLETSDDSNFVFTIIIQSFFGDIELLNENGMVNQLNAGDSFTSFDILNKRLSYRHSGRESRLDRVYLQAESIHHVHTQIPFWLEIQVIPENDNPPHLAEPYRSDPNQLTIYVKGERILFSSLLPWVDEDSNMQLEFFFPELFRDFTICRHSAPEIPVRNFSSSDLQSRSLLIRHVSLKTEAIQQYFVSDGKHTVRSILRFLGESTPFIRLARSIGPISKLGSPIDGLVILKSTSLWAETNFDMDSETIRFSIADDKESPFKMLNSEGRMQSVNSFTQLSIVQHRIFITPFVEPRSIRLRLSALHLDSDVVFSVEPSIETEPLQIRFTESISLPHSSTLKLDSNIWRLTGHGSNRTRFFLDRQPEHGSIILKIDSVKSTIPMNGQVSMFTKQQLDSGNLFYLHHGSTNEFGGDWFSFNFTIDGSEDNFGPFRFDINMVESSKPVLLVLHNISIPWGASTLINKTHLRALIPAFPQEDSNSLNYLITKKPEIGRLLVRGEEIHSSNNVQFTHSQLQNGQIIYAAGSGELNSIFNGQQQPTETTIGLKACQRVCSEEAILSIKIEADNLQAPELLRNEPLFVSNDHQRWTVITSRHLHTADPDTGANDLRYLVWQPSGGHISTLDNQDEPILSFTQQSVNSRQIGFVITTDSFDQKRIGFSFLVSDGLHQSNAEWFSVERDRNRHVELDSNVQLNCAPGVLTTISPEYLRARVLDVPSHEIIYQITRLPTHGKLVHENGNRAVTNFTQADIDSLHIFYSPNSMDLNAWSVRDHFNFVVANEKSPPVTMGSINSDNDYHFRLHLSFAFIDPSRLDTVLQRRPMFVSRGGTVTMNSTFLNLTKLASLCDDILFVEVEKGPKNGAIEFLGTEIEDDESENENEIESNMGSTTPNSIKKRSISADELHSGRHLLYRHFNGVDDSDEFVLGVYALRGERNKKPTKLKIPIQVYIQQSMLDTQVEKFRSEINLIAGGSTTLQPIDYKVSDPNDKHAELIYNVLQKGSNGVRLTKNGSSTELTSFTQRQLDSGRIRLEHTPSSDDKFDVIVLQVAGHIRVLFVKVEPIALQLFNHTTISFVQGKTYIVLERKHLGADSNGDRAKIIYNITRAPQNGSLYWVNGEQEVQAFTQKNIDNSDVLYAQLNMNAFQDSFDFIVSNEEMELLQKSSQFLISPPFDPQPLLTESRTIAQIGIAHLNASIFDGKSPRYLIVSPPKFGRFYLYPNSNETIAFFTQSHIVDGRVFYQSFEVSETKLDNITLELRADDVQPSRFNWPVRVASLLDNSSPGINGISGIPKRTPNLDGPRLAQPPELNYRFPILILAFVVISVITFLLCRKNKNDKKKQLAEDAIPNIGTRELPDIDEEIRVRRPTALQPGPMRKGNDLLDTTVYAASSSNQQPTTNIPSVSFMPLSSRIKATTFESGGDTETRRPILGPAYRSTALSAVTQAIQSKNPPSTLSQKPSTSQSKRLNDNQYWV